MKVNQLLPQALCLILIVIAAVILSKDLGTGKNLHQDEFHSLERSYGFIKHDDWWSVYSQNEISGKKPPLQYWLNALCFKLGFDELLSLRLWSYLFFISLLVLCAVFSSSLAQGNWWAGLASIIFLLNSSILVDISRSGLLDTGAALLFVLSLYALYLTQRTPYAWILCGLVIGLGALQKAPTSLILIPFAMWVMVKTGHTEYRWKALRQNKYFNRGMYLALFLLLIWPVIQCVKIGIIYLRVAIQKEMLKRFAPVDDTSLAERDFFKWIDWLWHDLYIVGVIAAACLLFVLLSKRCRGQFLFVLASVVLFILVAFTLASGSIYARYMALITPLLAIIASVVLIDVSKQWHPLVIPVLAGLSLASVERIETSLNSINQRDTLTPVREIIRHIDEYRRSEEFVVQEQTIIPIGSYGYMGESRKPAFAYDVNTGRFKRFFDREGNALPLIGIIRKEDTRRLRKVIADVEIIAEIDDIVYWRYTPKGSAEETIESNTPAENTP